MMTDRPGDRTESLLLIAGLLTPNHSATLIYLVRFFTEVSGNLCAEKSFVIWYIRIFKNILVLSFSRELQATTAISFYPLLGIEPFKLQ